MTCKDCTTTCPSGQFLDGPTCDGMGIQDTTACLTKTCTCSHGVAATGTTCPENGHTNCISCVGEFYLGTSSTCLPWSAPCNPTTEVESTSPSNVRDRSCKPTTTTYEPCKNKLDGDGCQLCDPQDTDCSETSLVKQCQSGTCDAHHKCTCSHGVARTGSACPVGGEGERCVSCSGDFYLGTHSTCMPWSAPCHPNTEVETASPSNIRDRTCDAVATGGGGGDETSDDISRCKAMEQSVCTPANKCIRTSSGGCIPYEDPSSESLE